MHKETKDFRVGEGDKVDLDAWPTKVDPVYKSKGQYKKLLKERAHARTCWTKAMMSARSR